MLCKGLGKPIFLHSRLLHLAIPRYFVRPITDNPDPAMPQPASRRQFLKTLAASALVPAAFAALETHPSVLMIAIDDMNNWIGALGGQAKTPNIDRLAASGVLFTNAYCVVPACNPSRVALMTGQRPETTGQFGNNGNFRDRPGGKERITLPQHCRAHGYEAVAAGKLYHNPRGGRKQANPLSDPASWDAQRRGGIGTPGHKLYRTPEGLARWHQGDLKMKYAADSLFWGPIPNKTEETQDWQTADYCADYLAKPHDKPFFLACGIFRPHSPQLAPQKYFDMYPLDDIKLPEVPEDDLGDVGPLFRRNWSSAVVEAMRKHGEWRKAVQGYLACMTFADDCVGHVMQALERSPQRDSTIVVFWTDHGWHLGDKGKWEKFTLWHQSTNSPLAIQAPGVTKPGQLCHRAVSFLDLYPTLIELCNLRPRQDLEGESLLPLLRDPEAPREIPAVITMGKNNHAVVWEHWNYIHYRDGFEELYDHRTDPHEYTNIAGKPEVAPIVARLRQSLPERVAR
jgi:arylsulfatase A-like enzyme